MEPVPVFPLPNVVFFPGTLLPLHIFEPRYRQMVTDALQGEKLIVMVLLKPGWERDYYGNPETHQVGSLGRITRHQRLPDSRYNITLLGLSRVKILEYVPGQPYRRARVEILDDEGPPSGSAQEREAGLMLRSLYHRLLEESQGIGDSPRSPKLDLPFPELVNHLASLLDIPFQTKQSLLEQDDLALRALALEDVLREQILYWTSLRNFRETSPKDPRLN